MRFKIKTEGRGTVVDLVDGKQVPSLFDDLTSVYEHISWCHRSLSGYRGFRMWAEPVFDSKISTEAQ